MPLAPKPENFNPGDLSCSPSDLSRSPGQVLRLGVLPLAFPVPSYIYFSSHYTVVDLSNAKVFSWCIFPPNVKGHIMHYLRENNTRCPVAACPVKLKSNKVNDDPLLAAAIDELCKTQNQNVTADVMDIAEFEE
ncbi:hypothetical protein C1H46_014594 [Malus baccata]|uniref:SP-RING-type domain-containing protein n=1 Tax=Malus baccata TaxID=106549 RepID=A0A540MM17_MALBA|nr:hypothetical protein C1H46_014594 [Malus baccata]